jgi:hypothetical protein
MILDGLSSSAASTELRAEGEAEAAELVGGAFTTGERDTKRSELRAGVAGTLVGGGGAFTTGDRDTRSEFRAGVAGTLVGGGGAFTTGDRDN